MVNSVPPKFMLRLFGSFELVGPDGAIDLNSKKLVGLLAFLGATFPVPQNRERLVELLWGSNFDVQARQSLRQSLLRLTRALGPNVLHRTGDTIALDAAVECDVARFETLLRSKKKEDLHEAVNLYRGPFLPTSTIREESWSEWVDSQRRRLEARATDTLVKLGELELQENCIESAIELAERACAYNVMREDAHRLVMRALADSGRTADALSRYRVLSEILKRELGAEPDLATRTLFATLRKPAISAAPSGGSDRPHAAPPSLAPSPNDPAELTILAPRTTEKEADRLEALISSRSSCSVKMSSEGRTRIWHVEAPTAAEAMRLALHIRIACGDTFRPAKRPFIGAHIPSAAALSTANVSQALAELAEPGELIASEEFRDQITDELNATVSDRGLMRSERLQDTVRTFALEPPPVRPAVSKVSRIRPTLAVLPFEWSADDGQAGRGELLAEELISALSRSNHLDVISRLSTRLLTGLGFGPKDVGELLQANYTVMGHIRRHGNNEELTVELVDAPSSAIKWRQARIVRVIDPEEARQVAQWIAAEVTAAILAAECESVAAGMLNTLESYSLLFAAISLMDRWTRSSFLRSRELLEELISRSPLHPLPNAWLSAWHVRSISQGWTNDANADGQSAFDLAHRSLDGDPRCSVALTVDGWANIYARKRLDIGAERLALAVEANPNDSLAWLLKGASHAFLAEGNLAADAAERALRLSPLDPRRSYFESLAATAHLAAGNYERAIELATRSLRVNRLHASTFRALATAHWHAGHFDDAHRAVVQMLELDPAFTVSAYRKSHPAAETEFGRLVSAALRGAGVPP